MTKVTSAILSDGIYYYENLIEDTDQLLLDINNTDKNLLDTDLLEKWHTWASSNDDWIFGERKHIFPERYSTSSKMVQDIFDQLKGAVTIASTDYAQQSKNALDEIDPRTISKYYTDSFMGPHTDSGPRAYISGVLYLNDDYEGGEIAFPNQGIEVKPSAGSMLFFPSVEPYIHNPKKVLSGEKYMVPMFWFKD